MANLLKVSPSTVFYAKHVGMLSIRLHLFSPQCWDIFFPSTWLSLYCCSARLSLFGSVFISWRILLYFSYDFADLNFLDNHRFCHVRFDCWHSYAILTYLFEICGSKNSWNYHVSFSCIRKPRPALEVSQIAKSCSKCTETISQNRY